jgi:PAS domain S-box-containing protein
MKNKPACETFFGALANDIRCNILRELKGGEKCVSDLVKALSIKQSLVSHNLKILVGAGLVHSRRSGTFHYYAQSKDDVLPAFELMERWQMHVGLVKPTEADHGQVSDRDPASAVDFFILDREGKVVINEGYGMEIVGMPSGDTAGHNVSQSLNDVPQALGYVQAALSGQRVHARMSGRGHIFDVRMIPRKDKAGKPDGVVGMAFCIDEKLRQEQEAREKKELFRSIVENLPETVVLLDTEGRVIFMNRELGGFSPEKAVGLSIYDFLPPRLKELTKSSIFTVMKTCEIRKSETESIGMDGRRRKYVVLYGPLMNKGKVEGVVVVMAEN